MSQKNSGASHFPKTGTGIKEAAYSSIWHSVSQITELHIKMSDSNSQLSQQQEQELKNIGDYEDFDLFRAAQEVEQESVWKVAKSNPFVLFIVSFASIAGLLFGYDQGSISGIITQQGFGAKFPRIYSDSDYKGWFVSTLLICAWFGSLVNSPIVEKYGRRHSFHVACIIFIIGSVFQCAGASVSMLFGGRAVVGFAIGMLTMVTPMYMAELAPSTIRGGLVVIQQLSITIGILVSYWIDYGSNYIGGTRCAPNYPYKNGSTFDPYTDVPPGGCDGQSSASWRFPFGIQILPAVLLGVGMIFLPESPRWLLANGQEEKSLQTLERIRRVKRTDSKMMLEFLEMKGEVIFEQNFRKNKFGNKTGLALEIAEYKNLFMVKSNFKRVFIGSAIMFFQQFMGCNALIYYAPSIFGMLGLSSNSTSLLATGVYGIVNCVSTIPAVFLVDKLGRKPLFMAGAIGTFISLIIVAGITGKYPDSLSEHKKAGWCAIAFVYIYDINFSYSFAPLGWILPSEIFSLGIRSKAISITTSSTWMCNFIIGLVTPHMLDTMKFGTYVFFAAFCLVAFFFVWFIVPETKRKSLEDMDEVFGDLDVYQNKHDMKLINQQLLKDLKLEKDESNRSDSLLKPQVEHLDSV